jgi:D-alanine-D-alanine ligase-like ATP-grasp enzyme
VVDEECQMRLKEQNLSLDYVPQPKERVYLGYTSNASRGGSYETVRMQICKKNRRLMVRAAEVLNLNLVGFDVECSDMNLPIEDSQGVIIEANHRPSIRIHEIPMSGAAKPVVNKIMRSLIYKHPLAYLHVLYTNRKTRLFVRSLGFAAIFSLLYKLLV